MQMNSGIILAGQTPDIMGNFSRGMEVRSQRNALATQENLSNLYRTQGAQILAGDQQALNALAGIDPMQALGVQQGQLGMEATRHGMKMDEANLGLRQEELAITKENARMRAAELAATLDAQTAARAQKELERAIAMGSQAQTPEQWDMIMSQLGEEGQQYVGQFENRDMIIAGAIGASEGLSAALQIGQGPEMTASQKDYTFYAEQEKAAGRTPLSFNDWDLQSRKASAANTTVTVGGPTKAETAAHNKSVKADNVNQVIDDILATNESAILPTTGAVGAVLSNIGGTAAGDMASNIRTLQAAASFGSLQAMREASPTGGALGAVSDTEVKLLQSELAALEQSQSQEQFLRNLERFRKVYNEIVHGPQANTQGDTGGTMDFSTMGLAEIGQVDIGSLTPEQMDALEKRMTELGL